MAALEGRHWWYTARREILRSLLSRHAPARPAHIVEIGCGIGGNLPLLAGFGPVEAIEASATARSLVPPELRPRVRPGALPGPLPLADASCDWVCMFDVLEHVDDHAGALRECRRLLRPGGAIVVAVPAHQWLWSLHDEEQHHRRRYDRRSLRQVAETAGLRTVHMTYFNTWLFPLAVAARLLDRFRKTPSGLQMPAPAVNRLMHRIFASEAALLRRTSLPIGLSLFAVLEPRDA